MFRLLCIVSTLLFTAGCTSYGVIQNEPRDTTTYTEKDNYSSHSAAKRINETPENILILSFSGGGTRAAAFAYGVLLELRDTMVMIDGKPSRLLDQVDIISSVSGGSFTSAYYGLHGDDTFNTFEDTFLRIDVQGHLIRGLFNPLQWFNGKGRTEMAVDYYDDKIFHDATFADLKRKDGPLILINASGLGNGVRFSFIQEYFNLLCSDIASFPVSRAVTASSAVPVLFPPIVVKNYDDCKSDGAPEWLQEALKHSENSERLALITDSLDTFYSDSDMEYAHFVDGGITDNLGLRAIYEMVEVAGGAQSFMERFKRQTPQRLVVISVNAATDSESSINHSNENPSLMETIGAMSDIQLHRYNTATLSLMEESMSRWSKAISTPEKTVDPYFIQVKFTSVEKPQNRRLLNTIPTSFSLTEEQVDNLITAGRKLLRKNPEFQQLVKDMGGRLQ